MPHDIQNYGALTPRFPDSLVAWKRIARGTWVWHVYEAGVEVDWQPLTGRVSRWRRRRRPRPAVNWRGAVRSVDEFPEAVDDGDEDEDN